MTPLIVVAAFVVMEPVTAAVHRWIMHGLGELLHRSHHRLGRRPGWERNDWFPVAFAGLVLTGFWLAFNGPQIRVLLPVGVGVTLYGLAYALVHDVYIHGRLPLFRGRCVPVLDRLAAAHRIHHLYGAAPYGMLVPVVPAGLRERAATSRIDPFTVGRAAGT